MEQLASAPGAHPPKVSGVVTPLGFQVWAASWGFSCGPPVRSSGCVQPGFRWVLGLLIPSSQSRGWGGGGHHRPQLLRRDLFLFCGEKFFLFKPPWSKQAPGCSHSSAWLSPKNPSAAPVPGPGLQPPWSPRRSQGPIVLKHSSYRQIFQCPLSLVSDLHMCWNTIGCVLCSSDQLGVSLVLRGSGLCSHLSRRHLGTLLGLVDSNGCHRLFTVSFCSFFLLFGTTNDPKWLRQF